MSAQLRTQKRLLTTFTNKLEHIVPKIKDEKLEELPLDPNASLTLTHQYASMLEEAISAINSAILKVEESLNDFTLLVDRFEESSTSVQDDYDEYSCKSESALSYAFDLIILLQARLQAMNSCTHASPPRLSATDDTADNHAQTPQLQTKKIELPPLPIPTFGGNIWEWENFWEIFSNNIHFQDIPEIVKYNYLLNALKGEARECFKKFQATKDNYAKAIEFLLSKYNNKEILINNLIEHLDACTMRSSSVRDQRSLLEEEQVIITQLAEKGEQVNSHWLIKKVLAKFPDSVKRKVISKRQGHEPSLPFTMETLFKYVDEILATEEMYLMFADKNSISQQKANNIPRKPRNNQPITAVCMYCRGSHSSFSYTKLATPQERSLYLRQNHLCLICASSKHSTTECKGRPCCNGAHHTSCCFKAKSPSKPPPSQQKSETKGTSKPITKGSQKPSRAAVATIQSNSIYQPSNMNRDNGKIEPESILNTQIPDRPYLLRGKITVMDNETRAMSKVDVLLDTGAGTSFIDSSLAAKLHLPVIEYKNIRLHTFGSKETKQEKCALVRLEGWDDEGTLHSLDLLTYDVLTRSFSPLQVSIEDRIFMNSLDISLSMRKDKTFVKPLILLGCDQLWSLMRESKSSNIPNDSTNQISISQCIDDFNHWDRHWSMDGASAAQIYTITAPGSEITEEEKETWDQYWAMDKAGTEEFSNTEKDVRAALDKRVWQSFNETIQRREDGYYVRPPPPWKEPYQYLPDNKALAQKRLANVWSSLRKDINVLNQYNGVFQEQLQNNIIEIVDETALTRGNQVHYIFRQPVFTPHKATTKLRIGQHIIINNYAKETSLSQNIKENLYVDNLILTTDTLKDAVNIYNKSKQMFQEIHMNLREFTSNSVLLTNELKESDRSAQQCPKVLGIIWDASRDMIQLSCNVPITTKVTKRVVMSKIAAIYDPLGWLVLLLHQAKIFLQELWKQQYDWDTQLPNDKKQNWHSIVISISGFEKDLPRFLASKGSTNLLVTFADASSNTVAYLYHGDRANIIMAKSKLPSIQVQYTIPKLELNAMTLAMRLTNSVLDQLHSVVNIQEIYVFSDSEVVLKWLQLKPEKEVGQFVHNRLIEIRKIHNHITEQNRLVRFGYVASHDNPADCGTRGLSRDEFAMHFWWTMQSPPSDWLENNKFFILKTDDTGDELPSLACEQFIEILTISKKSSAEDDSDLFEPGQVRTWTKAKRVLAYALRFLLVAKLNMKRINKIMLFDKVQYPLDSIFLSRPEVQLSGKLLMKNHQNTNVTEQIIRSLHHLNIQSDSEGILRCHGRLGKAQLEDSAKYPIFILQKSFLAEIIIRDYHQKWHPVRTTSDIQGKCYGAILTCMVTRMVYLDVVSDLTTTAFLNMLRRFFARRGVPQSITSDYAPTFDLGNTILQESIQAAQNDPTVIGEVGSREIDWRHITPYAPWQGGFYERLIKTVKHSLYKTLGSSLVPLEELSTVVCEIEALLNTRPLTYIANDFNQDQILRPINFQQRNIQLSYPLEYTSDAEDPAYLPPTEAAAINTKRQAIAALEASCKLTEKFWHTCINAIPNGAA
ncbi:Pao retrotransposon peptidase [Ancylostoma duodenale]|uniref:Pao retrotransposon peptidase n=1 Tax=Ancylostoma duodenale TaxID=51022 RepID=A0A0C2DKW6_9BILA|nr:Pao retrotransposon peptidase [Ancylostoma duodenale]